MRSVYVIYKKNLIPKINITVSLFIFNWLYISMMICNWCLKYLSRSYHSCVTVFWRRKNIIIRNAENIYPEEIEGVLNSCPQIKESFVYGEPHELLGEVPAAIIVINDGFEFKKQELINYCYNKLSSSKIPVKFIVANKIEKTSNVKIDRGFRKEEFVWLKKMILK